MTLPKGFEAEANKLKIAKQAEYALEVLEHRENNTILVNLIKKLLDNGAITAEQLAQEIVRFEAIVPEIDLVVGTYRKKQDQE